MLESRDRLSEQIEEAARFIRGKISLTPKVGIVLGTGLGKLTEKVAQSVVVSYAEIPHFPISTAPSHSSRMVFGNIKGREVLVMEGRFHYYEGYTLDEITFPIRVMKALGIETMILSCAAGGMNPEYDKSDIVVIEDHINFMGVNPLIGPNDPELGIRFPDMIEPYNKELIAQALKVAADKAVTLHKGCYVGVTGPNLETRAEYRMMRNMGADLVGMSLIPEVIVGVHARLRTLAFGVVTDMCLPDALEPVDIDKVIQVATLAGPVLDKLVEGILESL